jgi:hypothetical protein
MAAAIDLSLVRLCHVETDPMSTLAHRAGSPRWSDVLHTRTSESYFVLGQDVRGLWVIRESTGKKAGVFNSRKAALRFARMESPGGNFAVVQVSDQVEIDDAPQHL